jgi:hypothetical protein
MKADKQARPYPAVQNAERKRIIELVAMVVRGWLVALALDAGTEREVLRRFDEGFHEYLDKAMRYAESHG